MQPGQRVVLSRNARYWRKSADGMKLPFIDQLVLEIVPEQTAGMLRLEAGNLDLLQSELRPDDSRVHEGRSKRELEGD